LAPLHLAPGGHLSATEQNTLYALWHPSDMPHGETPLPRRRRLVQEKVEVEGAWLGLRSTRPELLSLRTLPLVPKSGCTHPNKSSSWAAEILMARAITKCRRLVSARNPYCQAFQIQTSPFSGSSQAGSATIISSDQPRQGRQLGLLRRFSWLPHQRTGPTLRDRQRRRERQPWR
jgi:hypothetical protein